MVNFKVLLSCRETFVKVWYICRLVVTLVTQAVVFWAMVCFYENFNITSVMIKEIVKV